MSYFHRFYSESYRHSLGIVFFFLTAMIYNVVYGIWSKFEMQCKRPWKILLSFIICKTMLYDGWDGSAKALQNQWSSEERGLYHRKGCWGVVGGKISSLVGTLSFLPPYLVTINNYWSPTPRPPKFKMGSLAVQFGLELSAVVGDCLTPLFMCWDYRHVSSYPVHVVLGTEPRNSSMWGR